MLRTRVELIGTTAVLCSILAAAPNLGQAVEVRVRSRDELVNAVKSAKPGTTILIAPGTYKGGLAFDGLQGAEGSPIVLAAAEPDQPPLIRGEDSGLHLSDPNYVELHNLVFEKGRGNGLNIDDGGTFDTPAQHIVLRRITVRDVGSDGNQDGIKLSGVDDFRIEECVVERWGKGGSAIDMVGCHRGEIVRTTVRDGSPAANGIQIKGGSTDVAVQHCRFENAGGRAVNLGGSTGLEYFRPSPQGFEAKDLLVEDCTFVGSMAPVAFVGVDGATVRYNVFYRPAKWVLRILQENQDAAFVPCRNGKFTNNIVVFRRGEVGTAVNVGPQTAPETFDFAQNFWCAMDAPAATRRAVQLPVVERDSVYGQDPKFTDEGNGDFSLQSESPAREFGPRANSPGP